MKKIILTITLFALILAGVGAFGVDGKLVPKASAFCLMDCGEVDEVSFTDFEGGLQAPSKEGYAPQLVQISSAREFIVKVVNFALGFLGLIAMIIIIYGGVRYVTSAGESDGVEKGKKSIMYAALGLIIVLGSYAIVNTILMAPTGTDVGVVGQGGGQTMVFSVEEMKNIPQAISNAYAVYSRNNLDLLSIKRDTENLKNSFMPLMYIRDMEREMQNMNLGIKSIQSRLLGIAQRSPKTSIMQERIQQYIIYTDSWLEARRTETKKQALMPNCQTANDGGKCYEKTTWDEKLIGKGDKEEYNCEKDCKMQEFSPKMHGSLKELADYLIVKGGGQPPGVAAVEGLKFMDVSYKALAKDNDEIVNETIKKIKGTFVALKDSVKDVLPGAEAWFGEVNGLLTEFENPSEKDIPKLKITAVKTVEVVMDLQKKLQNIQFVKVYLSADQLEGNVPFIVNFSTVGTTDPSGKNVQDSSVKWNLESGEGPNCKEKAGQVATCIYKIPGTYRVSVKVDSSDETKYAGGVAYLTIKVFPPKARIKLEATVNKGGTPVKVMLMDYDSNGFLLVDKPRLQITLTQAKNGIDFNASGTTSSALDVGGGATKDTIQRIKWDFGDRTDTIEGEPVGPNLAPKHYFTQPGEYIVILEVTDKNGIKDRKVFTVLVSSIAALIDISPEPVGRSQTLFMISGNNSSSDNSAIMKFEWDIMPDISKLGKINKSLFSTKFLKPNTYSLTLKVKDSQGEESIDTAEIRIESAPPIAKFTYSTPKRNQPAIIQFDGTRTYDPDGPSKDIIYNWRVEAEAVDYKFVSGDANAAKPLIKFNDLGTYKVALKASDKNEPNKFTEQTQEIPITSLLDIEWGKENTLSVNLDDKAEAKAVFGAISEHAVSYDFDFGDGEVESGTPSNNIIEASHIYKIAGVYKVKLTVADDINNKNSLSRKITIGGAKNPIAFIKLSINNEEYPDTGELIGVSRKDFITFDASSSLNSDGTKRNLKYQWDFGDGKKSTKDIATYTYKTLSKENAPYMITLKVTDASDPTKNSTDSLKISVISMKPTLKSVIALPESADMKTPLKVDVNAIEAYDPDGRIISYKWRYFDVNNTEERFGEQLTTAPFTTITIGTRGNEGDANKYKFSVILTDDENQEIDAEDILGIESLPAIEAINGPNKQPVAKFSADRTTIKMGESITFSSSSSDPDGKISKYVWDTDGEGFAGKEETQKSSITIKYEKPASEGLQVRLKVIDDNYAEAISSPITIYVLSKSSAPKAAFTWMQEGSSKTVKFKNNSTADEANDAKIEKYIWDFDAMSMYQTADSDGDGKKDNDTDSTEKEPSHTYPGYGTFYAKLTVIDNVGSKNNVMNPVILQAPKQAAPTGETGTGTGTGSSPSGFGADTGIDLGGALPGPFGGSQGAPTGLNLKVKTIPEADKKDGKIHLAGAQGDVTFMFTESAGEIVKIVGDKNIYFDSDKNGIMDDDINFQTQSKLTPWKTNFEASWGQTAVKITAYDKAKNQDSVIKAIVFDQVTKTGSLNVFVAPGNVGLYAALASMLGFGILSVRAFQRKNRKRPQ